VQPAGSELRDTLLGTIIEGTGSVRYHLRQLIGEGGQGWVYKANYDDPEGFWIVVKVLRPECFHGDALRRFEREAEVLRHLGSVATPNPHIVRFYDYGAHPIDTPSGPLDLPFIALEHVEGQTLARVIAAHGGFGLPITRVRRIMKQVARALHTVHEQRIIHRDLKPSNILLAHQYGQEIAKVTDFGLVKLPDLTAHRTATVAGASLGYAPPEQYEMGNHRVGVQTDVFAFSSMLYEMLCGSEAFPLRTGDSPLRVVARMLSGERPSLSRVRATVPRELRERADLTAALDRELARALSGDPSVRHTSIRELWEQIEPLLVDATQRGTPLAIDDPPTFDPPPVAPAQVESPNSYGWRIACRALKGERLRAAVIAEHRHSIVALGVHGLYYYARGQWSAMQLPEGVEARSIRGLARSSRGEFVIFGDEGLAMSMSRGGTTERFSIDDDDIALLGAHFDAEGLVLVGERMSHPVGVVVEIPTGKEPIIRDIEDTTRLHGVTRLAGGSLVVCGTQGALLELAGNDERRIVWGRTGHLYAISATADGGAFAVGSGGHALRIAPPPKLPGNPTPPSATLEVVQTTRDLVCVSIDEDQSAWAAGGQARLVHRQGSAWTRVPLDPSLQCVLIAVRARRGGVTALAEDGTVLEQQGPEPPESAPKSAY